MSDKLQTEIFSPQEIVNSGLCIGCGSCAAQAENFASKMRFDRYGQLKPAGEKTWFQKKSENFSKICPFSPSAKNEDFLAEKLFPKAAENHFATGKYIKAYVGHAAEEDFRAKGSSGGMVSWVLAELMRKKMIDAAVHVGAIDEPHKEGKFFKYKISRAVKEIQNGAKSRYYPVEMSEVLKLIRENPGRYAVVGVPCFIKAIQLLRIENPLFRERIAYTLGLFCGHFKSARFVESFAWQMNVSMDEVKRVEFRHKDPNRPANWYNARLTLNDGRTVDKDWWHLADGDWGAGNFMNSACNYCDDVVAETADISFGDAWVEPYSSDGRGTNVIVTRSNKIEKLVSEAIKNERLNLTEVDGEFVEATQAAGLRQRREGLAYRLTWAKFGVKPKKRVAPDASVQSLRRKLIYRMRFQISAWSHRVFFLARHFKKPSLYVRWAQTALSVYHGLAYSRGKIGEIIDKLKIK